MPVGARREQAARGLHVGERQGLGGKSAGGLSPHTASDDADMRRVSLFKDSDTVCGAVPAPRRTRKRNDTLLSIGAQVVPAREGRCPRIIKTARRAVGRTPWWSRAVDWLAVQRRGFPGAVSRLLAYRAVAYAADNLIGDGDQVCEFRFAPLR
jgi:hypothetical protein